MSNPIAWIDRMLRVRLQNTRKGAGGWKSCSDMLFM